MLHIAEIRVRAATGGEKRLLAEERAAGQNSAAREPSGRPGASRGSQPEQQPEASTMWNRVALLALGLIAASGLAA
jgi:hypothetical protein